MTSIKIEPFSIGQEKIVCDIHNQSFSYWRDKLGIIYGYKKRTEEDVKEWIKAKNSFILIAYDDKIPVGYTHYAIEEICGENREIKQ